MSRRLLRRGLVAVALVTSALLATALPSSGSGDGRHVLLGLSSPHVPGTTVESRVTALESNLGAGQFGALRLYHAWDEWFPQGSEQFLADPGRDTLPVLSVGTERVDGSRVWWRLIAEAQPGSRLHRDMVRWADDLRDFAKPIVVTLNHEPDFYRNGGTGSPYWYKRAFEKFAWILRNRGATNVRTAFVGVAWNFDPRSSTQAGDYYPGDAWVDVIGVDGYSWGRCRDANGSDRSVDQIFGAFLTWADQHPGKPLMIAEFGASEDPDAIGWKKRQWMDQTRERFADSRWDRLEIVTWWDNVHEHDHDCDFRIGSSWAATEGFRAMLADPVFN